jgi:hypothetical protein
VSYKLGNLDSLENMGGNLSELPQRGRGAGRLWGLRVGHAVTGGATLHDHPQAIAKLCKGLNDAR